MFVLQSRTIKKNVSENALGQLPVSCFLGLLVSKGELGLFFTCEDVSQGRDREREREGEREI